MQPACREIERDMSNFTWYLSVMRMNKRHLFFRWPIHGLPLLSLSLPFILMLSSVTSKLTNLPRFRCGGKRIPASYLMEYMSHFILNTWKMHHCSINKTQAVTQDRWGKHWNFPLPFFLFFSFSCYLFFTLTHSLSLPSHLAGCSVSRERERERDKENVRTAKVETIFTSDCSHVYINVYLYVRSQLKAKKEAKKPEPEFFSRRVNSHSLNLHLVCVCVPINHSLDTHWNASLLLWLMMQEEMPPRKNNAREMEMAQREQTRRDANETQRRRREGRVMCVYSQSTSDTNFKSKWTVRGNDRGGRERERKMKVQVATVSARR